MVDRWRMRSTKPNTQDNSGTFALLTKSERYIRTITCHCNDVIMTMMASQITSLTGCLLNRLFRRRSKKTSKLRVTGLRVGNSPGPVNSPPKGPVTRKMFPFDDVNMLMMNAKSKFSLISISDWKVVLPEKFYYIGHCTFGTDYDLAKFLCICWWQICTIE